LVAILIHCTSTCGKVLLKFNSELFQCWRVRTGFIWLRIMTGGGLFEHGNEPSGDEVTGGWRKLHNEELHGLYSSPSIIRVIKARRMRWAGHVAHMGEVRGAYILVGRPEGRRPLGRPRRRWEDNIKMDLRETGFGDVHWIHWAQDRDR
jgi:hypothetical protein